MVNICSIPGDAHFVLGGGHQIPPLSQVANFSFGINECLREIL